MMSPSTVSSESRRGNSGGGLWGLMNAVFEDPSDSFDENEGTTEEQVKALKNSNNKLKEELKKCQKKNLQLQKDLDKERETAKKELESFAKTLQGVDELRSAAETTSRQVNRYKGSKSLSILPEDEI